MSDINQVMQDTMSKIKEMVDVNTIVGDPIATPDGVTLIPVSRVSFGFASGGADGGSKGGAQPPVRAAAPGLPSLQWLSLSSAAATPAFSMWTRRPTARWTVSSTWRLN